MTQTLRVVGPNLPSEAKATFHVHAAGCADLSRGWISRCRDGWDGEYESRLALEAETFDFAPAESEGYELGDYQSEFYFAPCVHLPLSAERVLCQECGRHHDADGFAAGCQIKVGGFEPDAELADAIAWAREHGSEEL